MEHEQPAVVLIPLNGHLDDVARYLLFELFFVNDRRRRGGTLVPSHLFQAVAELRKRLGGGYDSGVGSGWSWSWC